MHQLHVDSTVIHKEDIIEWFAERGTKCKITTTGIKDNLWWRDVRSYMYDIEVDDDTSAIEFRLAFNAGLGVSKTLIDEKEHDSIVARIIELAKKL